MQLVPGHIPVLSVSPRNLQEYYELFEILQSKLAAEGLRIAILDEKSLSGSADDCRRSINDTSVKCDLVIIMSTTIATARRLVFGHSGAEHPADVFACRDEKALADCSAGILDWLTACIDKTPLFGCILIGGKSSRMGRPKHLIKVDDNVTWLERTINLLAPFTTDIMISGEGEIPAHLARFKRIQDIPGSSGPLSGVGAALQALPLVSWLVLACDMPDISDKGIRWLLARRRPGMAAVIPRNPLSDRSEPLCAWYDFRSAPLVEDMLARGELRIRRLCGQDGVYEPVIPAALCSCWRNVNRPDQI